MTYLTKELLPFLLENFRQTLRTYFVDLPRSMLIGIRGMLAFIAALIFTLPFQLADYQSIVENGDYASELVLGETLNKRDAVKKAETVFEEYFGREEALSRKPYRAYLDEENDVWLVKGLSVPLPRALIPGWIGEWCPYTIIRRSDGKVLAVW